MFNYSWDKNNSILLEENYPVTQLYSTNDEYIFNTYNNEKIIKNIETDYFLNNINLNSIFFKSFGLNNIMLENMMIRLFHCSSYFALLLFLNIYNTNNKMENFISLVRTKKINKNLLSKIILLKGLIILNINYADPELANRILENYMSSYEFSESTLYESLNKVLRNITMQKDFILIDKFSKCFSKIYFERLQRLNVSNPFNSENAVYMLVFILILLDIDFKLKGKTLFTQEKVKFLDLMILLMYLNEGQNFDNEFLMESYKYTKISGLTNIQNTLSHLNKHKLFLTKENRKKTKLYK